MTVFAVMATRHNVALNDAIEREFPDDRSYQISELNWLVSGKGTAEEISKKLGIRKDGIKGAVVMPTQSSYYGVAPTSLWDWLRARIEESGDG